MFGILDFVLWVLSSHQKIEHGVAVYFLFKPATLVAEGGEAWVGKRLETRRPLRSLRKGNSA